MKVNLTLLVPDWILQYQEWREFLEVLEESVNEVVQSVDDLKELYDLEKAKEFLEALAKNFGFGLIDYAGVLENVQVLDFQRGFIEKKSSEEFFKRLCDLLYITRIVRDLSQEIVVLSGGRKLSGSIIQDGRYYRDGSLEITCTFSQFIFLKELERFVHAGVVVWYWLMSGVYMAEREAEVADFQASADMAWKVERDVEVINFLASADIAWGVERESSLNSCFSIEEGRVVEREAEVANFQASADMAWKVEREAFLGSCFDVEEGRIAEREVEMYGKESSLYLVIDEERFVLA